MLVLVLVLVLLVLLISLSTISTFDEVIPQCVANMQEQKALDKTVSEAIWCI